MDDAKRAAEKGADHAKKGGESVGEAGKKGGEWFKRGFLLPEDQGYHGAEEQREKMGESLERASEHGKGLLGTLGEMATSLKNAVAGSGPANDVREGMNEARDKANAARDNGGKKVADEERMDDVSHRARGAGEEMRKTKDETVDRARDVKEGVKDEARKKKDEVFDRAGRAVDEAGKKKDEVFDRAGGAAEEARKKKDEVFERAGEKKDEVVERGRDMLDRVKGSAEEKVSRVRDEVSEAGSRLADRVKDTAGILRQRGEEAAHVAGDMNVNKTVRDDESQPVEERKKFSYEEAKNRAEQATQTAKAKLENAGKGLLETIGDMASELTEVVQMPAGHVQSITGKDVNASRSLSAARGKAQVPPNTAKTVDAAREETELYVKQLQDTDKSQAASSQQQQPQEHRELQHEHKEGSNSGGSDKGVLQSVTDWVADKKQEITEEMTQRVLQAEKAANDESKHK